MIVRTVSSPTTIVYAEPISFFIITNKDIDKDKSSISLALGDKLLAF